MQEETTTEHIANIASTPDNWLKRSVHLLSSAEIIFEKCLQRYYAQTRNMVSQSSVEDKSIEDSMEYLRVGFLLAGYGFEILFKYLYVKQKQEYVYSTILKSGNIPTEMRTHNLLDLAKLSMLPLNKINTYYLKKLSDHSSWAGRYPVSLNANQFDKSLYSLMWSAADVDTYYDTREEIFELVHLDYSRLKHLGIGLIRHTI